MSLAGQETYSAGRDDGCGRLGRSCVSRSISTCMSERKACFTFEKAAYFLHTMLPRTQVWQDEATRTCKAIFSA